MIIVQLQGGLGNQLFQYALGRRLSVDRRVPLKFDLSWYKTQAKRRFDLGRFAIPVEIATDEEVRKTQNYSLNPYLNRVCSIIGNRLPYWKRRLITERAKGKYDQNVLRASRTCYLHGYWQSEKYFKPIESILKGELLQYQFDDYQKSLSLEMKQNQNSVCVHVRRGDYVAEHTGHWVCPADYYLMAMDFINRNQSNSHFYFFSDDIEWVKANLHTACHSTFINNNDPISDLQLMASCTHHINANSSFSWWGAWLREGRNSIVIVPNRWYQDCPFPDDLVPDRWIRL